MRQKHSLFSRTAAWLIAKLDRFVEPVERDETDKAACSAPVKLELPETPETPEEEPKTVVPAVEDMTLSEVIEFVASDSQRRFHSDEESIRSFEARWQAQHHEYTQRMRSDYLMKQVEEEAIAKEQYRRDIEAKKEEILERLARYELDTGVPFFEWYHTADVPQLAASEGKGVTPADVVAEMVEPDIDPDAKWTAINDCPTKGSLDVKVEPIVVFMPTSNGKGESVRTETIVASLKYKGAAIIIGTFTEDRLCQVSESRNISSFLRNRVSVMPNISSFLLRKVVVPSIMERNLEEAIAAWNSARISMRRLPHNVGQDMKSFMQTMAHLLLLETKENQEKVDLIRLAIQ